MIKVCLVPMSRLVVKSSIKYNVVTLSHTRTVRTNIFYMVDSHHEKCQKYSRTNVSLKVCYTSASEGFSLLTCTLANIILVAVILTSGHHF